MPEPQILHNGLLYIAAFQVDVCTPAVRRARRLYACATEVVTQPVCKSMQSEGSSMLTGAVWQYCVYDTLTVELTSTSW